MCLGVGTVSSDFDSDGINFLLDPLQTRIHPIDTFDQHLMPFAQNCEVMPGILHGDPDLMRHHCLNFLQIVFCHLPPNFLCDVDFPAAQSSTTA